MQDSTLVLLTIFCLLSFSLAVFLLTLLVRSHSASVSLLERLLEQQTVENQHLRNQLRSPDLQTLQGLNYATLPSTKVEHQSGVVTELDDLGETINFEDRLARHGYETGDLGYDLESAGWSHAVTRRDGEDPTAFDLT